MIWKNEWMREMVKQYHRIQKWDSWITRFPGEAVQEAELVMLRTLLRNLYGKHIVTIGTPAQINLFSASELLIPTLLSPIAPHTKSCLYIESQMRHLPILSASVDVVMLPHILELVENPRQLLTESCRIVKPEGYIVICGFNPFSLWGLRKWLKKSHQSPWDNAFISCHALKQWLNWEQFVLIEQQTFFHRPYCKKEAMFEKWKFCDTLGKRCFPFFGSLYIIVAQAKVIPLTPIKLSWKQSLTSITFPGVSVSGSSIRTRLK